MNFLDKINFLDKLKNESEDLQEKIIKLENFMQSKEFQDLNNGNRFLLYEQLRHMKNYNEILRVRISINENEQRNK